MLCTNGWVHAEQRQSAEWFSSQMEQPFPRFSFRQRRVYHQDMAERKPLVGRAKPGRQSRLCRTKTTSEKWLIFSPKNKKCTLGKQEDGKARKAFLVFLFFVFSLFSSASSDGCRGAGNGLRQGST